MTKLDTKAFGSIDVDPRQIIKFPDGILGFPENVEFALLEDREDSPFKWLQSTIDRNLAFVLIQPEIFLKDGYSPEPAKGELEALGADSSADCLVFCIVTIPENEPNKMTANLQGPILINAEKKIGRQVISSNDRHGVRVSIMEQLED